MRRRSKVGSKPAKARRRRAVTQKVARLAPELSEALDQQAATSEVLRIISSSPTDAQPVFDTIARSAARLCKAQVCWVFRFDGKLIHFAAQYGLAPKGVEAIRSVYPIVPGRVSAAARSILSGIVEEIPDIYADHDYEHGHTAKIIAYRSVVAVPMLKNGRPIGAIAMARSQTGRFPDRQVELLKIFADQAVIAIENTRLFDEVQARSRELSESLEQQTAMSEVLRVISSSPGELEPVFEAMLENAVRICEAGFGLLQLRENGAFRTVAMHNPPPAFAEARQRNPLVYPSSHNAAGRVFATKQLVHIADYKDERAYKQRDPAAVSIVELAGARTVVVVPMLKERELVGSFGIYRQEVRPFTDKQIALVENFAAQAVIAIENARLLSELRQRTTDLSESLERQTATSEVLSVISSSSGELEQVFQTILANATRISSADFGTLSLCEGDAYRVVALHNPTPELAELRRREPVIRPGPATSLVRSVQTKQVVQIADMVADQGYTERDPARVALVELAGFRSVVSVPMLKGSKVMIQEPMKFELVINVKTAKALGLSIPQSMLLLADKVIE